MKTRPFDKDVKVVAFLFYPLICLEHVLAVTLIGFHILWIDAISLFIDTMNTPLASQRVATSKIT